MQLTTQIMETANCLRYTTAALLHVTWFIFMSDCEEEVKSFAASVCLEITALTYFLHTL